MSSLGVVALFYSNVGAAGLLRKLLESAGFVVVVVVSAPIDEASDHRSDVDALIDTHNPSVIVYDIGPPFAHSWRRFQDLRAQTSMRNRRFVITAVDAARVERLGSDDERIFEVVDKDSDLVAIVQAVKEAARARTTRAADAAPAGRSNLLTMPDQRQIDRRQSSWTPDDIYRKLREKQEQVEGERRRGGRRSTDVNNDPHHHAA